MEFPIVPWIGGYWAYNHPIGNMEHLCTTYVPLIYHLYTTYIPLIYQTLGVKNPLSKNVAGIPRSPRSAGGSGGSSRAGEPRSSKDGGRNLKGLHSMVVSYNPGPPPKKARTIFWYISGIHFCQLEDWLIQLMGKLVGFSCKNPQEKAADRC